MTTTLIGDPDWVGTCPLGHEHRFEGDVVPTLDDDNRCLRCGHQLHPEWIEEIIPAGVLPAILDIQIEMRMNPLELTTLGGTVVETVAGPVVAILHVQTTNGPREILLDETEVKHAEKFMATPDNLRAFAKWVFARRGIVL